MTTRYPRYSVPIILPSGPSGGPGIDGTDGQNGVGVLYNLTSFPTFSALGDQSIDAYSLPANIMGAGDGLMIEAIISVPTVFVGSGEIYITFGGSKVASLLFNTDASVSPGTAIDALPVISAKHYFKISTYINFKTANTQTYLKSSEFLSYKDNSIKAAPVNIAVATNVISTIDLRADLSTGANTYTCEQFLITKYEK